MVGQYEQELKRLIAVLEAKKFKSIWITLKCVKWAKLDFSQLTKPVLSTADVNWNALAQRYPHLASLQSVDDCNVEWLAAEALMQLQEVIYEIWNMGTGHLFPACLARVFSPFVQ